MKTNLKTGIFAFVALAVFLSLSSVAAASFCAVEQEYIVVFHPGITWKEAAGEVAAWGNSFELAAITSQKEQRYVMKLLGGLQGEFWTGGYENASKKWQWTSGEAWGYTNWAKGEPDKFSRDGKENKHDWKHEHQDKGDYGEYFSRFSRDGKENKHDWKHEHQDKGEANEYASSSSEHYLALQSGNGKNRWMWYGEENGKNISGFIAERHTGPAAPVPVPPAALLLGSGIAMVGGLHLKWKKTRG
jgi:hypothetical protein